MKTKLTYKDSLFRDISNDKKRLQGIYRALTGQFLPLMDINLYDWQSPHRVGGTSVHSFQEYTFAYALVHSQAISAESKSQCAL